MKFAATVRFMNAHGTSGRMASLEASSTIYYVTETEGVVNSFDPSSRTIEWNPNLAKLTTNYEALLPATMLGHEIDHANQYDKHPKEFIRDTDPKTGSDSQLFDVRDVRTECG